MVTLRVCPAIIGHETRVESVAPSRRLVVLRSSFLESLTLIYVMQDLAIWAEELIIQLPPLLQLILGMFLSLGVFKLLLMASDAYDNWQKKKSK